MGAFSKIFGGLSSKSKNDILNEDHYIETIINHGENEPLGVSKKNVIYAGFNELGGYYFLQTYIIGALKIKTKNGATLLIEGDDYTFDLNADMDELESEDADVFKGSVTKIDFEIEKNAVEKIKRATLKQLVLTIKKNNIVFSVYDNASKSKN